jgi:hypothetical protein
LRQYLGHRAQTGGGAGLGCDPAEDHVAATGTGDRPVEAVAAEIGGEADPHIARRVQQPCAGREGEMAGGIERSAHLEAAIGHAGIGGDGVEGEERLDLAGVADLQGQGEAGGALRAVVMALPDLPLDACRDGLVGGRAKDGCHQRDDCGDTPARSRHHADASCLSVMCQWSIGRLTLDVYSTSLVTLAHSFILQKFCELTIYLS